ncbi:MAG: hypothetical protein SWJ54_00570 [Cyanobacteriota bacterium]|nr:hypothetical protein [Cyanobacteriota bacterium]
MTETTENQTTLDQANLQEVTELIQEYETYRERLLNQTLEAAKRAKLSKAGTMAKLEPQLAHIDSVLKELRDRVAVLSQNHA